MDPRFCPTTIVKFVNPPDYSEIEARLQKIKSEHAARRMAAEETEEEEVGETEEIDA